MSGKIIVRRKTEVCPACGQFNPWRKTKKGKTLIVHGKRRSYVYCRRCGAAAVLIYE